MKYFIRTTKFWSIIILLNLLCLNLIYSQDEAELLACLNKCNSCLDQCYYPFEAQILDYSQIGENATKTKLWCNNYRAFLRCWRYSGQCQGAWVCVEKFTNETLPDLNSLLDQAEASITEICVQQNQFCLTIQQNYAACNDTEKCFLNYISGCNIDENCKSVINTYIQNSLTNSFDDFGLSNTCKNTGICELKLETASKFTCGAFGDPHFQTSQMTFQTCSLIGTHTLFSSQFLVITMNSVGINPNYPQASGIEQIHLTYKDPCYSFSLTFTPSSLPSFPQDIGPLFRKVRNFYYFDKIKTQLQVRSVSNYLQFGLATGIPGGGLCSSGCQEDYSRILAVEEHSECAGQPEQYKPLCNFDLTYSTDTSWVQMYTNQQEIAKNQEEYIVQIMAEDEGLQSNTQKKFSATFNSVYAVKIIIIFCLIISFLDQI